MLACKTWGILFSVTALTACQSTPSAPPTQVVSRAAAASAGNYFKIKKDNSVLVQFDTDSNATCVHMLKGAPPSNVLPPPVCEAVSSANELPWTNIATSTVHGGQMTQHYRTESICQNRRPMTEREKNPSVLNSHCKKKF